MMKRILAALLCLTMVFASLYASADTVHVYPEVKVSLLPDDTAQMEAAFRQWAQQVLFQYYGGRYYATGNLSTTGEPYAEYYRLAATKTQFDGKNVNNEDVIYNTYRDADWTQNEGVYTWVLIESMKEAVRLNESAIEARYHNTPEDERRYLVLDISDGGLVIDEIAKATQEQADEYAQNAWCNTVVDVGVLAIDYMLTLTKTPSFQENGGFDEWVDTFLNAGDTLAESLGQSANANAKRNANNMAREVMINNLATQLYNYDAEIVHFLRNTYSEDNNIVMYGHAALVEKFIDMIDPDTNPQMLQMLADEAVSYYEANAAAIAAVEAAGQEYLELMDTGTMLTLGGIEVFGSVFTDVLDTLQAEIDGAVGDQYITYKGKTVVRISWATLSDILLGTLSDTVDNAVESAIDELYEEFNQGMEFDWDYAVNKVKNSLCTALSNGDLWEAMVFNLVEAVPELGFEIFGGNQESKKGEPGKKGKMSGYKVFVDLFSAVLDSKTMIELTENGDLTFEEIVSFVTDLLRTYNISKQQNDQAHTAYTMTMDELESKMRDKWKHGSGEKIAKWNNEFTQGVVNLVLDVCDRTWEVGAGLRDAVDSTAAAKNGEGVISLYASRVVAARNLSNGVRGELRSALIGRVSDAAAESSYDFVLDPEQMPLEEVVELISYVHTQLKYDIIGTSSYYNIVFQGSKDEKFTKSKFWENVENNHTNVFGQKGFITTKQARDRYNWTEGYWRSYYVTLWDSSWQVFLDTK